MKTKEQILAWLDKQPWKSEFYEVIFLYADKEIAYDKNFLRHSFYWSDTAQGSITWAKRDKEYREWYNSNRNSNVPRSWEEYCRQTPIPKDNYFISSNSKVLSGIKERYRDADSDVSVMPKELCEAFLAYMKLIQLRNAWVKNENLEELPTTYKILYQDGEFDVFREHTSTGLSFVSKEDAKEFAETFKDILDIAKPLL